jgi:predicted Holliday junction resolvase-like endonuclease
MNFLTNAIVFILLILFVVLELLFFIATSPRRLKDRIERKRMLRMEQLARDVERTEKDNE